jgi:VWFA-related protein
MLNFRFSRAAIAFCLVLLLLLPNFSAGQDIPVTQMEESEADAGSLDPFKISVNVSEVRLDVVVVDNKGRPITDLTAADFEIYQNKMPQEVTSSIYIENQADDTSRPTASRKDAPNLVRLPGTILKEEDVRRTIVFVVDNLSMGFDHLYNARMSIKGFLEKQMQPGDLVAVIRTGSGNSALNFFSSDKRQINKRVDSIPYEPPMPTEGDEERILYRIYDNQLSTLSYSIRALKDMPGRKIILFLTSLPTIIKPRLVDLLGVIPTDYHERYGTGFDRLAEDALRAGVVVHSLDTTGLSAGGPNDLGGGLNPLPAKTGGTYIQNSNFFLDGIGRDANNMIAGYYLLSYVPPASTFNLNRRNVYHRVQIRVKRKGATVYTRDGFYGRTENEADSAPRETAKHPLQDAIFSPFQYADLDVNIAAGYVKDANAGYLVRSWIHLDPKDLTITETEDGGALISLDTVILTSDINGYVQDLREVKHTFSFTPEKKSENLTWIQKHGIQFLMLLPVKKPGSYTVRIAVLDTESGKVGSAYQPVEIPDLKKKGLALSNIFVINSTDDLVWMRSDVTKEITEAMFFPVLRNDEVGSPALRTYMPGDSLQTLAILYNADAKDIARSEIEVQSILYKDGVELIRGEPRPVTREESAEYPDGIPFLRSLMTGRDMPPGDYLLQLLVTDKKNSQKRDNEGVAVKKDGGGLLSKVIRAYLNDPKGYSENTDKGVASQTLSFTVAEP